jgi:hypothetical protein
MNQSFNFHHITCIYMILYSVEMGTYRHENNAIWFRRQPHCEAKGQSHLQCENLQGFRRHASRASDYSYVWVLIIWYSLFDPRPEQSSLTDLNLAPVHLASCYSTA